MGFATPSDVVGLGEPANKRVERETYPFGCALNALRNKEGTGHGCPWDSSITPLHVRFATESMGRIARLLLDALP
ncbi:abortive infection family protein [Burkholderia sp. BCC0398]|uniref:abortive infection family protein n=1 Tax=Burkholderia sp. BCC0398 TaxID=2676297 RepID=UPI0015884FA3|nr:abortive infection family protein [Burkholderia sp. BCC0398]